MANSPAKAHRSRVLAALEASQKAAGSLRAEGTEFERHMLLLQEHRLRLKQIQSECPGLAVLMLSTYPDNQFAVRCIRAGAAGYLNKSADPDDIVAALRKAAAGGRYLTPAVADLLARSDAAGAAAWMQEHLLTIERGLRWEHPASDLQEVLRGVMANARGGKAD